MVFICATSRRPYHLAQRLRTATASGLVPLLLLTSVPACATRAHRSSLPAMSAEAQPGGRTLSEWSRVEAVPVGTPIEVHLYDDEAPPNSRRVTGRFHAATADTLTLTLEEQFTPTRTLAKSAVHIVSVRRPIRERPAGWLTLVGGTVGLAALFASHEDLTSLGGLLFGALYAAPASLIGFLLLHRKQQIYQGAPAALRLVTQVDVPVTDGDVIPRSLEAR